MFGCQLNENAYANTSLLFVLSCEGIGKSLGILTPQQDALPQPLQGILAPNSSIRIARL